MSGYQNNRTVDAAGARHTGLTAFITDAKTGKAIEGAAINIAALNKTAISGINGIAQLSPMRTCTYHVAFTADGYTTQTQDITIARSKVVEVAVALVEG